MTKTEKKNIANKYSMNKKDTMLFNEEVNFERAKYINSLDLEEFKELCWDESYTNEEGKSNDIDGYYTLTKKALTEIINKGGKLERKYKHRTGSKEGRIYVEGGKGVQNLQWNIRGFLCEGIYTDIDMKNAHPVILNQLCKKLCITSDLLQEYIDNREELLGQEGITKLSVLICLYDNKKTKTTNQWLRNFDKEMKLIQNAIYKKKPPLKDTNSKNPTGSNLSRVLAIEENKILQAMAFELNESVGVPMFDGMLVKNEAVKENTLEQLEKIAEEKTGYKIKLVIKPHNTTLEIPEGFSAPDPVDYDSKKEYFEINNFMIRNPVRFVNRTETYGWQMMSEKDFTTLHRAYKYEKLEGNKVKKVKLVPDWLEDENKRIYDGLEFHPGESKNPLLFNTFTPFTSIYTEKENRLEGAWEQFKEFINLVGGEEKIVEEYLLNYTAHLFQKTETNPQVGLVIKGEQGCGKDTYIDILERLIGLRNNYIHRTSDPSDIYGGVNECLKDKFLVQFNEVEGKDSFSNKEKIKDTITRAENIIHEKYAGKYKQKNHIRIVFISNNLTPVEIPYDDRRFVVTKISSKYRKNAEYFTPLHKNIRNQEWLNTVYSELMDRDIEFFEPANERPETQAYKNMRKANINPLYKFLKAVVEDPDDNGFDTNDKDENYIYATPSSFNYNFKHWLVDNQMNGKAEEFKAHYYKKIMAEVDGIAVDKKVKLNKDYPERVYYINKDTLWDYMKVRFFNEEEEEEVLDLSPACKL